MAKHLGRVGDAIASASKKNPFASAAKIGQRNSPVKPRTEAALRRLLRKKGISSAEFEKQFSTKKARRRTR